MTIIRISNQQLVHILIADIKIDVSAQSNNFFSAVFLFIVVPENSGFSAPSSFKEKNFVDSKSNTFEHNICTRFAILTKHFTDYKCLGDVF